MTPLKQNSRVSGFGGGTTADIERAAAHRDFDHVVEFPQDIERANAQKGLGFEQQERRWLQRELRGVRGRRRAALIRGNLMGPQL